MNQENVRVIELLEKISQNGIKIIDDFWQSLIVQASGAFFGAFFAFIFGLIAFRTNKVRERFFMHQKAVVELEYLLNEHLNYIAKNEYLITNTIEILKQRHYTYNKLQSFRLPENLELRLGDLDVINKYVDYKESIVRLNSDFEKVNGAFDNLSNFALTQGIPPADRNFSHLIEQLELINKFLKLLLNETKNLLVFVRIYLRRIDSFKEKWINIYKLNNYREITNKELKTELKKLNKEIAQTIKKSKEKIKQAIE